MMFATIPFIEQIGFDRGFIVGYTAIVLSFLFVFFGMRAYRDQLGGAPLSFGRAFAVGLMITLISCVFYVVAWQILYRDLCPTSSTSSDPCHRAAARVGRDCRRRSTRRRKRWRTSR